MADKNKIQILAVEGSKLPSIILNETFVAGSQEHIMEILQDAGAWFGPRGVLEGDERFKQIIPYLVIRRGDKYVTYVRGTSGGEARLHGKRSIGLGGHVDISDATFYRGVVDIKDTVEDALWRELNEEVSIYHTGLPGDYPSEPIPLGFIYDGKDEVGRVHLGLAYVMEIGLDDEIKSNEDSQQEIQLLTREELLAEPERLEGWSEIVLRNIT